MEDEQSPFQARRPGNASQNAIAAVLNRPDTLRTIAIILALISAGAHLTLSVFQLIPGEATPFPLFAGMGIGYLIGSVGIFLRKPLFYRLVILYSLALILAYGASRDSLPVEPIGLLTKLDEGLLILSVWFLIRSPSLTKL